MKSDSLFCVSVPLSLSGEKVCFRAENGGIRKLIVLLRANQIARITCDFQKDVISNGNRTEWGTIQGVIARVISKSDEREARGRFEITSTITP